ncbi:hypothetical protein Clacol_008028 [Clathrus columnatus]|uniref:beta-glucosidase n=1 Tax=Clathrus columnatus TaxID=1419009 RepID=A0AAV5AGL1_9AGAM|nr:hypothetical protein Clacol_008028 [Clathrus columnatus]
MSLFSLPIFVLALFSLAFNAGDRKVQSSAPRSWSESRSLAQELVANLSTSEKVGILTGQGIFSSRCTGGTYAVNRSLPNAPNGFPSLCMNDGPAGIRGVDLVTGFPGGLNAASTFSRRLMQARGQALAEEAHGKGINIILAPQVDLMRSPKAGRVWESFGPDPWLSGEAAYTTISGIQSVGVQACAKHFLGYIQELWRYTYSVHIDDRTIHEMYLWPFMRAIEANVSSIMCAYNQFNGTYSCGNENLLGENGLLRNLGFQGFLMSDWGATHPTTSAYARAGLDMEQPGDFIIIGGGIFGESLTLAVDLGFVTQSRLNEMTTNVITPWFRLGQDQGYPPPNYDSRNPDGGGPLNGNVTVRSEAHTQLVREIAAKSSVLLKNENGALPLKGTERSMAVIGLDVNPPQKGCDLNACDGGVVVNGWGSGSISYDFVVAPIDALISYSQTTPNFTTQITNSSSNNIPAAVAIAKDKDVALVFVNAMSGELGAFQEVNGNFGDRNNMNLWYNGDKLIGEVASVNNNTIVIIHSTGPVLMEPWSTSPNVTGIIYAGTPGEQAGPAIVDILYGLVNPSGRLPFTIAKNASDYPADILYLSLDPEPSIDLTETLFLDYRSFDARNITPRYEFGYGLSYTSFEYSDLTIDPVNILANLQDVDVGNRLLQRSGEPPKLLRGFEEVDLAMSESQIVQFSIQERDLRIWDTPSQTWIRPAGSFEVYVGGSSRDIRLTGTLL